MDCSALQEEREKKRSNGKCEPYFTAFHARLETTEYLRQGKKKPYLRESSAIK